MNNDAGSVIVQCGICTNPFARKFGHEHHIVPKAAHGSESPDNKLLLCASCHMNLHRLSEMIKHGHTQQAEQVAKTVYKEPRKCALIMKLASQAATARAWTSARVSPSGKRTREGALASRRHSGVRRSEARVRPDQVP